MRRKRKKSTVNKQRLGYRKRKQLANQVLLLIFLGIIIAIIFQIRDIKKQLKEIWMLLQQEENIQTGMYQIGEEEKNWQATDTEEAGYVININSINVDKPVQRTREEMLQKLAELAQIYPAIAKIYKDTSSYPESMLMALANNPEMTDFVAGYPNNEKNVAGGLTTQEKEQDFPLFLQWDIRWGYQDYGEENIGLSGCGPTCLSMVMYYLTGDESFTPDRVASYSMENGYYAEGTGTTWLLMRDFPQLYGIKVTEPSVGETTLKAEVDSGSVLICAMREGDFTTSGHFIVIYGYKDGKFLINDPNCIARSKGWAFNEIEAQIKSIWAYRK